jgi:hypothetical protein
MDEEWDGIFNAILLLILEKSIQMERERERQRETQRCERAIRPGYPSVRQKGTPLLKSGVQYRVLHIKTHRYLSD